MTEALVMNIIGWLGAAAVLYAYLLISTNRISSNSRQYQFFNVLGAFFLVINTWYNGAIPSMVVNIIWILVALYATGQKYFTRTRLVRTYASLRPRKLRGVKRRV